MNQKTKYFYIVVIFSLFAISLLSNQIVAQQNDIETVLAQKLARIQLKNKDKVFKKGILLNEICYLDDTVSNRVFREYGSMFIGKDDIFAEFKLTFPNNQIKFIVNCVFRNENEVDFYQRNLKTKSAKIGETYIELREDAMNALLEAIAEAKQKNLRITPRGGSIAAKRSYQDTKRLWDSRFYPALSYWVKKRKISRKDAEIVRGLEIHEQVAKVLEWEDKGFYFSKDLSKSILYSVAAPGASQHIFMLALDVEQFANKEVRRILANHGWFQTVKSDLPHFTFLGVKESELRGLGLKPVPAGGQIFWIPNIVEPTKKSEVKKNELPEL